MTDQKEDSLSDQEMEDELAPMSSTPLKNNSLSNKASEGWSQIAGHAGSFLKSEPGTMCKRATTRERMALPSLMEDALVNHVPKFYKETIQDGEPYIQMQDLLYGFNGPCVMDCKIGYRTFLESEVQNEELRPDLLGKMRKLSPGDITAEEEKAGGVTKLRYMQFRENLSSTSKLGFRIEGIKTPEFSNSDTKTVGSSEAVKKAFAEYFQSRPEVRGQFITILEDIRKCITNSEVFRTHEVVGSSLLFVYDQTKADVWIIDFGKTEPVEAGRVMTHTKKWERGNREDGYLIGFDNLLDLLRSM